MELGYQNNEIYVLTSHSTGDLKIKRWITLRNNSNDYIKYYLKDQEISKEEYERMSRLEAFL